MAKNLTMIRGNTVNIHLRLSPIKLRPSDRIRFTAKPVYDEDKTDDAAAIRKDITDMAVSEDGTVSFMLTPKETDVTPGKYVYDITINFDDERRTTVLGGKLTIKPVATLRGIK